MLLKDNDDPNEALAFISHFYANLQLCNDWRLDRLSARVSLQYTVLEANADCAVSSTATWNSLHIELQTLSLTIDKLSQNFKIRLPSSLMTLF